MKPRDRGFALILVIWSLVLLSSLAGGFAYAVRHEARVAADIESIARAEAAAVAGLHTAVLSLASSNPADRWQADTRLHEVPWPGAVIKVKVRSESGRIDLNRSPQVLLAGLFAQLFPDGDAEALADAVIDWRDRDDRPGPAGAERDTYVQAGYSYTPKNLPFDSVGELSRVIGFDSAMVARASAHLTVNSHQPRINVASADLLVLAAVPGISRDDAETFVAHRERVLAEGGALDYTALRNGMRYLDKRPGSRFLSIDIEVRLTEGLMRRERAVIRLEPARGYQLLARETRPVGLEPDGTGQ
jgi:general secretion pathway protein K